MSQLRKQRANELEGLDDTAERLQEELRSANKTAGNKKRRKRNRRKNKQQNAFSALASHNEEPIEAKPVEPKEPKEQEAEEKPTPTPKKNQNQRRKPQKKKKQKPRQPQKEEDLDAIIKQVTGVDVKEIQKQEEARKAAPQDILAVTKNFADPHQEMVKLFGQRVVSSATASNGQSRGRRVKKYKKTFLVTPNGVWPSVDSSMLWIEPVENTEDNDDRLFKVCWSTHYELIQGQFFQCVETGDPSTLTALLQQTPYHADTLLQLADTAIVTGQIDMNRTLIKQLVYLFETLLPPAFEIFSDRSTCCRLLWNHEKNRVFHLGLWKYMEIANKQGCTRSAFELCKLIMSLDPSDPLGALLAIDNPCIRAGRYNSLVNIFKHKTIQERGAEYLPNMVFGVALATLRIHEKAKNKGGLADGSVLLENAVLMFPSIIKPLLQKIGLKELHDTDTDGNVTDIMNHAFYVSSYTPDGLKPLLELYLERNHALWKEETAKALLTASVIKVAKLVVSDNDTITKRAQIMTTIQEKYEKVLPEHHRHIILSGVESATMHLPGHIRATGLQIYDNPPAPAANDRQVNAVAAFLMSLLPWQNNSEELNTEWFDNLMGGGAPGDQAPQGDEAGNDE